jgi:hypothetical protein
MSTELFQEFKDFLAIKNLNLVSCTSQRDCWSEIVRHKQNNVKGCIPYCSLQMERLNFKGTEKDSPDNFYIFRFDIIQDGIFNIRVCGTGIKSAQLIIYDNIILTKHSKGQEFQTINFPEFTAVNPLYYRPNARDILIKVNFNGWGGDIYGKYEGLFRSTEDCLFKDGKPIYRPDLDLTFTQLSG